MSMDIRSLVEPVGRDLPGSQVDIEAAVRTGRYLRIRRRVVAAFAGTATCAVAVTAAVTLWRPDVEVPPVSPPRAFPAVDYAGYGLSDPVSGMNPPVSLQQATSRANAAQGTEVTPEVTLRLSSGQTFPRLETPVPTWVFVYHVEGMHPAYRGPELTPEQRAKLDAQVSDCTVVYMVDATTGAAGAGGVECGPPYDAKTP